MRCPIDSTSHWRRCWQENCLSPFGLQDIHTHAKASPKQPEAALLIGQCMFSLCSACVTSAATLHLRHEKIVGFFLMCKQQSWKYVPVATCGPRIYWALETVQVWFFIFLAFAMVGFTASVLQHTPHMKGIQDGWRKWSFSLFCMKCSAFWAATEIANPKNKAVNCWSNHGQTLASKS